MTTTVLTAQVSQWLWVEQAGGSGYDNGNGISTDADGNSYVTGFFQGTATFGAFTLTSSGGNAVFVAKLDKDGNWLWAEQTFGTTWAESYGISVDENGNSYVFGFFNETTTFGSFTLTSTGGNDVFVAKLDKDGNWLWAEQAGGSSHDYGWNISIDADGNSYVTGEFQGTAYFGAFTITSSGSADIFAAKIDTDGNWQWAKKAGGTSVDKGLGISTDAFGNSYVTGHFKYTATFGAFSLVSSGGNEIFVAKLDTDGNWQWAKKAGGSGWDHGYGISTDAFGNSYVTGGFQGTSTFGSFTLISTGGADVYVAELDTDGNWLWVEQAGGSGDDEGKGISIDANGNSYVTGNFQETATFGTFTLISNGSDDIFAAELNTDRNWQWAKQAGGIGSWDYGRDISVGANGNSYVIGYFQETATFGDFTLTSSGSFDIFVAKLYFIIGDFNDDGYVDASDLQLFGDHWHFVDTDPDWDAIYDLDPDGTINAADLQIFGDHWHEGTPPTIVKGDEGKGPNAGAGIEFDLDANTSGNQHVTAISSQPADTYIRLDVYATGVHNLDTYEFEVVYNVDELDYISSSATNPITYEGNILTTNGGSAVGWMVDNSTPGILSIAYTLTGTDTLEAPEGDGLVADIVFQAKVDTYGILSFGEVYYYDTFGVSDLITDTGTATLPVELSVFTATYNEVNGYATIEWTTASENDVIGFNMYRSTEDEFDTSKKINAEIIVGHGTTTEMNTYEFVDLDQLNFGTTYYYWLESVEFGGTSVVYSAISLIPSEGTGGFVEDFEDSSLSNYPNPVNGSTTISYSVKGMLTATPVEINIYNMLGQLVDTVDGRNGTATWNTSDHAIGIYFYKLNTDSYTEIRKMMVTK